MTLLLIYVFLALAVSFLCSVFEAVLLSVTPSYIASRARQKKRGINHLKTLKENIDRPLAAILTLNTVAHTVGAAGAGAQAAVVFGSEYLGVISAVLTLLILVLSEIIPKTIGATYWQQLAPSVATSVHYLVRLLLPAIWLLELMTRKLSGGKQQTPVREELEAMVEEGAATGQLAGDESRVLMNLLQLRQCQLARVMTPRTVVFSLPETMTVQEYMAQHQSIGFSRIPVYGESRDDVSGYVMKDDVLAAAGEDRDELTLGSLVRTIPVVGDWDSVPSLLNQMLRDRNHIAMVVNMYGDMTGIVTLEDLLETLLGREIMDESDGVADMQQLARDKWSHRFQSGSGKNAGKAAEKSLLSPL